MRFRAAALSMVLLGSQAIAFASDEFFESKVRPLLAAKCYSCHTNSQMGGLRLDTREGLLKGGTRGPAVNLNSPGESLILSAVSYENAELKMPPSQPLSDGDRTILKQWLKDGAPWPAARTTAQDSVESGFVMRPEFREFWSFQPIRDPQPPAVQANEWPQTGADNFVLAKLEKAVMAPAPPADRRTLIRRASFDLIGLPPTPEEVEAFVQDESPDAFAKVVDRLLGSPHYGERWGRHWLDLARYGDGVSAAQRDTPLPNAYRYRDWVVEAFNRDMPYDLFIKAQLAADLLPEEQRGDLMPGLGFHAARGTDDDRVDVTGRVFLGLTIGCAQCHDHKFDPIPTQDYYSLQGVFASTVDYKFPLAEPERVEAYDAAQKEVAAKKEAIDIFLEKQRDALIDVLMERTADYLVASWEVRRQGDDLAAAAEKHSLHEGTLQRWIEYLDRPQRDHHALDEWDALMQTEADGAGVQAAAERFHQELLAVHRERRAMDDRNYVKLGGLEGSRDQRVRLNTSLEFLAPEKWYLWRDMASEPYNKEGFRYPSGVYYYGPDEIRPLLNGVWAEHLEREQRELTELQKAVPKAYPYLHASRDADKSRDLNVAIRGDAKNKGELAPRRFLRILSDGDPKPFGHGSGRLELAEAIADKDNPLTARVMANRVWQHHFGRGIVASPSNFGRLGEPPTHPELLDYLASRLISSGWSIKALQREIMLSSTYQLSSRHIDANYEKDPAGELYWRWTVRPRLDAETLRDSILFVSGKLDSKVGGPSKPLSDKFTRRAIYGTVSRTTPDRMLTLFDFPDPKAHSEERSVTVGPLQRLFLMNSDFVMEQAGALAERVAREAGADDADRIRRAYALVYSRTPSEKELETGLGFVHNGENAWKLYAQALLSASEFSSIP